MNNKQLFDSLGDADDKYIIEAVEDYPELGVEKKRGFIGVLKYALPCAACAAVLFAGVAVIGNRVGGFTPLAPNEDSAETSEVIEIDGLSGSEIDPEEIERQNRKAVFAEQERRFEETFVSPGIVYGEPLALPEIDPATFWEGGLPVMPLKKSTNAWFEGTGNKFSPYPDGSFASRITALDAKRGEAVYALEDGEVTYIGIPGSPVADDITVIVKHSDDFYTTYSQLDEDCGIPVSVGDKVTAGQVIGYAGLSFNFIPSTPEESFLVYGAYTYDPLDYLSPRTEYFENWLNSGLVKPLDNAGDDFEFDNASQVISRNEKITPAPYGANVYAVSSGKVIGVGDRGNGIGLLIEIEHEVGIHTVYYHLDESMPHVETGDIVSAGDVIGHVSDSSYSGVSGLGYFVNEFSWVRDVPAH